MRKLIRVDMSQGKVQIEDLAQEYSLLGGRGLTSTIVAREVPPLCHPLDPYNKLVVAAGFWPAPRVPTPDAFPLGPRVPLPEE